MYHVRTGVLVFVGQMFFPEFLVISQSIQDGPNPLHGLLKVVGGIWSQKLCRFLEWKWRESVSRRRFQAKGIDRRITSLTSLADHLDHCRREFVWKRQPSPNGKIFSLTQDKHAEACIHFLPVSLILMLNWEWQAVQNTLRVPTERRLMTRTGGIGNKRTFVSGSVVIRFWWYMKQFLMFSTFCRCLSSANQTALVLVSLSSWLNLMVCVRKSVCIWI